MCELLYLQWQATTHVDKYTPVVRQSIRGLEIGTDNHQVSCTWTLVKVGLYHVHVIFWFVGCPRAIDAKGDERMYEGFSGHDSKS